MTGSTTREHIVAAADDLFYRQGYEHTSFTDIADAVQISRGNFYYHFKTKDEILDAVIALRLARTETMLADWEAAGEHPADRIRSFIAMWLGNGDDIMRYGCPVGTLCGELAKLRHASHSEAVGMFTLFREWLRNQFAQLGSADADDLAMQLLARSQGVAALAQAFADKRFIAAEVERMSDWLTTTIDNAEGSTNMFVVLLELGDNRAKAPDLMESHTKCTPANAGPQDYLQSIRQQTPNVLKRRLRRAVREGDLPASADIAAIASFYATVIHGLAVRAGDGASRRALMAAVDGAMAAWDGLTTPA